MIGAIVSTVISLNAVVATDPCDRADRIEQQVLQSIKLVYRHLGHIGRVGKPLKEWFCRQVCGGRAVSPKSTSAPPCGSAAKSKPSPRTPVLRVAGHAFDRLPTIEEIPDAGSADQSPEAGDSEDWSSKAQEAVFTSAAHFPVPGYDRMGGFYPQQAIVVYEGMTVRCDNNGRYEVSMVVQRPATAVTLFLQLDVHTPCAAKSSTYEVCGSITLPPLRLPAPTTRDGDLDGSRAFRIVHRGYSATFDGSLKPAAKCLCGKKPCECRSSRRHLVITRRGTARIGSLPK